MRKSQEFEVEGVKYLTTQYSGSKSIVLLAKLAKIIAKPAGALMEGGLDMQLSQKIVTDIVDGITSSVEPEQLPALIKDILEGTILFMEDGKNRQIIIDTDFQGNLMSLFKILKEVLAFQYGDFFGAIAGAAPALTAKVVPTGRRVKAV